MWHPFKNRENKENKNDVNKKGYKKFNLAPGQSAIFGFHVLWAKGKDEVTLSIGNDKVILTGKEDFRLVVSADNIDPLVVRIVPDFRNRKLDLIEVIDANNKTANKGQKIVLQRFEDDIYGLRGKEIIDIERFTNYEKEVKKFKKRQLLLIMFEIIISGVLYIIWNMFHNWIHLLLLIINVMMLVFNSYWYGKIYSIARDLKIELAKDI